MMTVSDFQKKCNFEILTLPDPDREIIGAYSGDLLSWVMGRAKPDQAWITIMTNVNVLAVASLIDLSVIICCENSIPDAAVIEAAQTKGINMLLAKEPAYEVCVALSQALKA